MEERRALYKEKAATPPSRPAGPSIYDNGKGIVSFRTAQHKFLKNRRLALGEMEGRGFTGAQVAFIRDGMVLDGWKYHDNLPARWMYKQYNHKIEGVDKDVVDYLAPNGTNMRSKKSIKDRQVELGPAGGAGLGAGHGEEPQLLPHLHRAGRELPDQDGLLSTLPAQSVTRCCSAAATPTTSCPM